MTYTRIQDERIFKLLCNGKGPRGYIQSPNRRRLRYHKRPLQNIWEYMSTRFSWVNAWPETSNIVELLYCIDNRIEEQPVCRTCGKPIHFRAKVGRYGWYCNQKCQQNSEENKAKMTKSLKENNPDLGKRISEILMSKPMEERQAAARKRKQTIAEKHDGNENWVNVEAIKAACAKRTDDERRVLGQKIVKARTDKWGPKGMPEESFESMINKANERWSNQEERDAQAQRIHNYFESLDEDGKRIWSERASNGYANMSEEKRNETNKRRRQTIASKSQEEKAAQYNKAAITRLENMQSSDIHRRRLVRETNTYNKLCKYFSDAKHGYVDKRYANENGIMFKCDIYIPSKDAFIECQYHQSHGNSAYTFGKNPEEDKSNIDYIISQGYDTDVFLRRDPMKRDVAKKNCLNYFELWGKKTPYQEILGLVEKIRRLPTIEHEDINF